MRVPLAVAALALLLLGAAAAAPAAPVAAPRLATVDCDDATGSVAAPAGTLYGARLGLSWGTHARKLALKGPANLPYWAKLPLFIRGGGRAFTIQIAPAWHAAGGMAWDARGDAKPAIARGVRVVPCPGGDEATVWLDYPGGFYVARPACLPLVIAIGAKRYRVGVPLGRACP